MTDSRKISFTRETSPIVPTIPVEVLNGEFVRVADIQIGDVLNVDYAGDDVIKVEVLNIKRDETRSIFCAVMYDTLFTVAPIGNKAATIPVNAAEDGIRFVERPVGP